MAKSESKTSPAVESEQKLRTVLLLSGAALLQFFIGSSLFYMESGVFGGCVKVSIILPNGAPIR
jgi:hypothetical protein